MFARLLTVAETGILGGGMLSCLAGACCWTCAWALSTTSAGGLILLFDDPRFQDILSFLRKELMEEGVCGSSIEVGAGVGDFVTGFSEFCGRGPAGFWKDCSSKPIPCTVAGSPLVLGRLRKLDSKPPFGADDERKGDMLCLFGSSTMDDELEVPASGGVGVMWWV